MLSALELHINGRHHTLLPSTSLEASRGEVLLIQGDGQESRTALALALTGRMKPSSGTVALGHDDSMAALRKRSAVVDSPEVSAPENHLTVRSLVSEDLALVPWKFRDRTRPTAWIIKHGFRDILEKWVEELESERLLQLQLSLALADQNVELVVIDSPDRHSSNPLTWLPSLEQAATGQLDWDEYFDANTPPRQLMVIAIVGSVPEYWEGPTAAIGEDAEPYQPLVEPEDTDETPTSTSSITEPLVEPDNTDETPISMSSPTDPSNEESK